MYCLKCGRKTLGASCDTCGFNIITNNINSLVDGSLFAPAIISIQSRMKIEEKPKQDMFYERETKEEIRRRAREILGINF